MEKDVFSGKQDPAIIYKLSSTFPVILLYGSYKDIILFFFHKSKVIDNLHSL